MHLTFKDVSYLQMLYHTELHSGEKLFKWFLSNTKLSAA